MPLQSIHVDCLDSLDRGSFLYGDRVDSGIADHGAGQLLVQLERTDREKTTLFNYVIDQSPGGTGFYNSLNSQSMPSLTSKTFFLILYMYINCNYMYM